MSNVSGTILQLLWRGSMDIYFNHDPEITFFKHVVRKYEAFSKEITTINFISPAGFGKTSTAKIPKTGDLLNKMYLKVELPSIKPSRPLAGEHAVIFGIIESQNTARQDVMISTTIVSGGTGYVAPPTLTIDSPYGGMMISATIAAGVVDSIIIVTPSTGSDFIGDGTGTIPGTTSGPFGKIGTQVTWPVTVSGGTPTTPAEITVTIESQAVGAPVLEDFLVDTNIESPGSGYLHVPRTGFPLSPPSFANLLVEVILKNGTVDRANIIGRNSGSNIINNEGEVRSVQLEIIGGIPANSFRWCEKLGHALINSADLTIGNYIIDRHYGTWMTIWSELVTPLGKRTGYDKMIGHVQSVYKEYISQDSDSEVPAITMYIPFHFWFCNYNEQSLPLISLVHHPVKLIINFNQVSSCFYTFEGYFAKVIQTTSAFGNDETIPKGSKLIYGDIEAFVEIEDAFASASNVLANFMCPIYFEYSKIGTQDQFPFIEYDVVGGVIGSVDPNKGIKVEINGIIQPWEVNILTEPVKITNTLYSPPDFSSASIMANYVFLSERERFMFAHMKTNQLITTLYTNVQENITSGLNVVKLTWNAPMVLVAWAVNLHENFSRKYYYNLSSEVNSSGENVKAGAVIVNGLRKILNRSNPMISAKLEFNGFDRTTEREAGYYDLINQLETCPNISTPGLNVYSFAIQSIHSSQPNGSANFGVFENIELKLTYGNKLDDNFQSDFRVYGLSHAVLEFTGKGTCYLKYKNNIA